MTKFFGEYSIVELFMKIFKNLFDAFTIFFLWVVLSGGIALAIFILGSHGAEIFVILWIGLGVVGGGLHSIIYLLALVFLKQYITPFHGFLIGLFPVSFLVIDAIVSPMSKLNLSNYFDIYLMLGVTGAVIGWIVAQVFKFARSLESNSWS